MKIYPVLMHNSNAVVNKTPQDIQKEDTRTQVYSSLTPNYNDYLLFFGARVDKGLERFYEVNKDKMPKTVKEYIEGLDNKEDITPLEAQQKAFEYLELADTIEDIKAAYPDEPLFKNLKDFEDTKATKGLLYSMRYYKSLYDSYLKNNENFTVYLVKKIFLENKTIDEINDDLDEDLDEDLKIEFQNNNKDSEYVVSSTIKALGIQTPDPEYRNSLRYTIDGYSDKIGQKIAQAQKEFWESLSPEERTARAKKAVKNFENWWASIPNAKKLEMIAEQQDEIDLLEKYKADNPKKSQNKNNPQETEGASESTSSTPRTTVGSSRLSQDDLFKIWAKNNLKLYWECLSDSERATVELLRSEKMAQRWINMKPEEKTAFIEKLKAGIERQSYVMIDAWNNSFDIIKDLSAHLIANQVFKPANLLYSTEEFSEFQSRVMNEFWETHPEHAKKLGENIIKSHAKVKEAISNGRFGELKREIDDKKRRRIRDLEKLKLEEKVKAGLYVSDYMPEYMQTFKDAYKKEMGAVMKYLPDSYNEDYFRIIKDNFSEEQVKIWTKNLLLQPMTEEDYSVLKEIMLTKPLESQYNNRALEGALAEVLYGCTKHPIVYSLSFTDLKVALSQIDRKEKQIDIYSSLLGRRVNLNITSNKIDKKRIESLYHSYKKPLSEDELKNIAEFYFSSKDGKYDSLIEYLKTYGNSLNIVFSNKSVYPSNVKFEMVNRIMRNMPKEISDNYDCYFDDEGIIVMHDGIRKAAYSQYKAYNFIPDEYFTDEISSFQKVIIKKSMKYIINIYKTDQEVETALIDMLSREIDTETKIKSLAMTKTLADIAYEATEDHGVYYISPLKLCNLLDTIKKAKLREQITNGFVVTQIKKKPIISKHEVIRRYHEYLDEINLRRNDYSQDWNIDELICALNPNENAPEIDEAIKTQVNKINLTFER